MGKMSVKCSKQFLPSSGVRREEICFFLAAPRGTLSYIGMCRPKGYDFLRRLGLKTDIDFTHFNLVWNRVLFSRELQECMNVFIASIPNKKVGKINMRIRNGF